MKTARPYQAEAAEALFKAVIVDRECHPVAALPTGSGKTMAMCEFIDLYLSERPLCNILVLSHVKEILEQNFDALEEHFEGIDIGLYSAGMESRTIHKITVAGIQSVYRRIDDFRHFDVVIIDECHLVGTKESGMYRKFLGGMDANYVGLTATHFRTGHGYIHIGEEALFNRLVYNICDVDGFRHLIESGWLCRLIGKGTEMKMNVRDLKIKMGDFAVKQMSQRFDRDSITKAAVLEVVAVGGPYKKWLVFAIDVKHAEHIASEFNDLGIPTGCIHSKMELNRDWELTKFRSGEYRCMVNVNVLTTGLDIPNIDLIAMLRPTQSPVLHIQTLGRGMRISDGKDHCLVLDFAGNLKRLGPINEVSIRQRPKRKGMPGPSRMKECPECQGLLPIQAKVCEFCGHAYKVREKIQRQAYTGEVIKMDSKPAPPPRQWMDLTDIKYYKHEREGKPMMMKVMYLCGLRAFTEYVCYDHPSTSFPKYKAISWVRFRLVPGVPLPFSCEELIRYAESGKIRKPRRIQVMAAGRYPSIDDMTF